MNMNKKMLLVAGAVVVAVLLLRAGTPLPAEQAREQLKAGAVVVDVRTPEEFAAGALPGTVNIPVDSIKSGITNVAPDKSKVILLHCRSGRRSAQAEKELRSLGYTNAFNIGSFEQAKKVVTPEKK
jgi:phage shock protein E